MAIFLDFIQILCEVLTVVIILRAILSWFVTNPINRLVIILNHITEPILAPLRRVVPRVGMIDFTPMVAIILLQLIIYLLP